MGKYADKAFILIPPVLLTTLGSFNCYYEFRALWSGESVGQWTMGGGSIFALFGLLMPPLFLAMGVWMLAMVIRDPYP